METMPVGDVQRGRRIRALRERLGWTPEKLGAIAGLNLSSVRSWESGESPMPEQFLPVLAQSLRVPVHELRDGGEIDTILGIPASVPVSAEDGGSHAPISPQPAEGEAPPPTALPNPLPSTQTHVGPVQWETQCDECGRGMMESSAYHVEYQDERGRKKLCHWCWKQAMHGTTASEARTVPDAKPAKQRRRGQPADGTQPKRTRRKASEMTVLSETGVTEITTPFLLEQANVDQTVPVAQEQPIPPFGVPPCSWCGVTPPGAIAESDGKGGTLFLCHECHDKWEGQRQQAPAPAPEPQKRCSQCQRPVSPPNVYERDGKLLCWVCVDRPAQPSQPPLEATSRTETVAEVMGEPFRRSPLWEEDDWLLDTIDQAIFQEQERLRSFGFDPSEIRPSGIGLCGTRQVAQALGELESDIPWEYSEQGYILQSKYFRRLKAIHWDAEEEVRVPTGLLHPKETHPDIFLPSVHTAIQVKKTSLWSINDPEKLPQPWNVDQCLMEWFFWRRSQIAWSRKRDREFHGYPGHYFLLYLAWEDAGKSRRAFRIHWDEKRAQALYEELLERVDARAFGDVPKPKKAAPDWECGRTSRAGDTVCPRYETCWGRPYEAPTRQYRRRGQA